MKRRVSLIVQLLDDRTSTVIRQKNANVYIPGFPYPVYKEEGYFVFLNLKEEVESYDLTMSLPQYFEKKVKIVTKDLEKTMPIRTVRLFPKNSNVSGRTKLVGKGKPGETIRYFSKAAWDAGKLLKDCEENSREIVLLGNPNRDYTGKYLLLENKEHRAFAKLKKKDFSDGRTYFLESSMEFTFRKQETKVYMDIGTVVNDKGEFVLSLEDEEVEQFPGYLLFENGSGKELIIHNRKENRVDD